jgi:hypothetical protein
VLDYDAAGKQVSINPHRSVFSLIIAPVPRFRSSQTFAATADANFGSGALAAFKERQHNSCISDPTGDHEPRQGSLRAYFASGRINLMRGSFLRNLSSTEASSASELTNRCVSVA